MDLAEALRSFQDHAGISYPQTQRQADRAWEMLKQHLTRSELSVLSTARQHASQEGRGKLDDVCAAIRKARRL